jgi:hypothetical protein
MLFYKLDAMKNCPIHKRISRFFVFFSTHFKDYTNTCPKLNNNKTINNFETLDVKLTWINGTPSSTCFTKSGSEPWPCNDAMFLLVIDLKQEGKHKLQAPLNQINNQRIIEKSVVARPLVLLKQVHWDVTLSWCVLTIIEIIETNLSRRLDCSTILLFAPMLVT